MSPRLTRKGFLTSQREGIGGGGDFLLSVRGMIGPQGEWPTHVLPCLPSARREVHGAPVCGVGRGLRGCSAGDIRE